MCQFCKIRGSECLMCEAERVRREARAVLDREAGGPLLELSGFVGPLLLVAAGAFFLGMVAGSLLKW